MSVTLNASNHLVLDARAPDSAPDILRAVDLARELCSSWSATNIRQRCSRLLALRLQLAESADSLAASIMNEIGKPLQEALGADILPALAALQWVARAAPGHLRQRRLTHNALQAPHPYGVVGVIGTWNYPVYLNIATIAWALAAGNAVVWKPSEHAAATCAMLATLFKRAGLPVITVQGGPDAGRALCDAGCDKIAFTGGAATGRRIMAALARTGTPSVMELSGCDAMIVCSDADVTTAARSAVWGRCSNAGQICVAPQRIFVVRENYDDFVRECAREIECLKSGQDYGPMRTRALAELARDKIIDAMMHGAHLAAGERCGGEGNVVPPTLLADCTPAMAVMREDFFGPVLAVSSVRDENEAILRANDCEMALGASIWTRDVRHGRRLAARLDVGLVSINEVLLDAADPALPFGGMRGSGFGKQRGVAGLDEFVQWKVVVTHAPNGARRHLFPYRPATLEILRGLVAVHAADSVLPKLRAIRALAKAATRWQMSSKRDGEGDHG